MKYRYELDGAAIKRPYYASKPAAELPPLTIVARSDPSHTKYASVVEAAHMAVSSIASHDTAS